ncbi:MAG: hypothetical protein AAF329_25550 [Cyanobacteria bacterium P01_A01_bin.17]
MLLAGPLADRWLEPGMMPGGAWVNWLSPIFGNGPSAGMAILYTTSALTLLLLGIGGWFWPQLWAIETAADAP